MGDVALTAVLANSWKLFPAQHIHYTVAANAALEDDSASGTLFDPADADCTLRDFHFFKHFERGIGLGCRDEYGEASFICDIERIETENFTGTLYGFIDRN